MSIRAKQFLRNHWPVLFLIFFVFLIAAINFKPGTVLTGWDDLHPEYNLGLNIKRSLFAVWQEYQGLGLLGGMGHSADLIRQLFLALLSLAIPIRNIRFVWTMLTVATGGVGAYYLISWLIQTSRMHHPGAHRKVVVQALALLGALFYICNLGTAQQYYAPFEVFTAHFAFLPWLLLTGLHYLYKPHKKQFWLLILCLVVSTPAAYVPTLFVVYLLAMVILCLTLAPIPLNRDRLVPYAKRVGKLFSFILLVNAFWLLPFLYFTFTNVGVNVNAKINQMATQTIAAQNLEFGHWYDVMQLKGFLFNIVDLQKNGSTTYMLAPWRAYFSHVWVNIIGYLIFGVIMIGLITAFRHRNRLAMAFGTILLFAFCMLASATPPFFWIDQLLGNLPLFSQIFRFTFTKFSILAALSYAAFFALGMLAIIDWLRTPATVNNPGRLLRITASLRAVVTPYTRRISPFVWIASGAVLLVIFTLPMFRGNFFYVKEQLNVPKDYQQLFDYFATQDKSARIADFPQHTFWGWNFYTWGYGGSGFLWYGIEQPILDRAFDVWSQTSEQYYYEMANAVYTKDAIQFENVLNKYQIKFIIVDHSILHPTNNQALFLDEIDALVTKSQDVGSILAQSPDVRLVKTFGSIEVYQVDLHAQPNNFVFLGKSLLSVNKYSYTQYDQAYNNLGTYAGSGSGQTPDLFYLIRSLFTQKDLAQPTYAMQQDASSMTFSETIPANTVGQSANLVIPSYLQTETVIPVTISTQIMGNTGSVVATYQAPKVTVNNQVVSGGTEHQTLFTLQKQLYYPLNLNVNGMVDIPISFTNQTYRTVSFISPQTNVLTLADTQHNKAIQKTVSHSDLLYMPIFQSKTVALPAQEPASVAIQVAKITDGFLGAHIDLASHDHMNSCDVFRRGPVQVKDLTNNGQKVVELTANNATACISYYLPNLFHTVGYVITVNGKQVSGRPPHFWVLNEDEKYAPIDIYVNAKNNHSFSEQFILAPMEQYGRSYSLHFDSISIGDEKNDSVLTGLTVYPLPYTFLNTIRMANTPVVAGKAMALPATTSVDHPNESLYIVQPVSTQAVGNNTDLILSQSFDRGWQAYAVAPNSFADHVPQAIVALFPMVFGHRLEHTMINNWENGWQTNALAPSDKYTVYIQYLPQYLEYIGFLLLVVTVIGGAWYKLKQYVKKL